MQFVIAHFGPGELGIRQPGYREIIVTTFIVFAVRLVEFRHDTDIAVIEPGARSKAAGAASQYHVQAPEALVDDGSDLVAEVISGIVFVDGIREIAA